MRQNIFILGTPFCGSTLFGQSLNKTQEVFYAGELDRLKGFSRYEHLATQQPDIYIEGCLRCEAFEQPCGIWNAEFISEIVKRGPHREIYELMAAKSGFGGIVDGSKTPQWFRSVHAASGFGEVKTSAIHLVKNPFYFASSWKKHTGEPAWRAAEVWRDINIDAIRVVNSMAGVAWVTIRYEDFASLQSDIFVGVRNLLGLNSFGPEHLIESVTDSTLHSLGGNMSAYLRDRAIAEAIVLDDHWHSASQQYKGRNFEYDEKWLRLLSEAEYIEVFSAPGVAELASNLGYNLLDTFARSRESAA